MATKIKKLSLFLLLLAISALLHFLDLRYSELNLHKWAQSFLSLGIIYSLYQILQELIINKIKNGRSRHSIRKVSSFTFALIAILTLIRIWSPDPQSILLAYVLVGAGVAVSL